MEEMEYHKMSRQEKDYWWHKGKLYMIDVLCEMFLPEKSGLNILEIGCGTGEVLEFLKDRGSVSGIDFSETAAKYCQKRGIDNVIVGDFSSMELQDRSGAYDLVLALDVLEHIRNDTDAMKKVLSVLKPGGLFLIAVPAYKFLWSTHDEALHHLRRYHSLELKTKLRDSGFNILKSTHFVAALFAPIAFFRLLSNFVRRTAYPKTSYMPVPKVINELFVWLLKVEAALIKFIYIPVGTTLVVMAQKPN